MTKKEMLTPPKNIAVIGLSNNPERPSFQVVQYLLTQGFQITPINPMVGTVLGLKSYPKLSALPNIKEIDIVDIFRQPEHVLAIVEEVLSLGIKPAIWLQEGVIAPAAKKLAEENGLTVIMDECMQKEHKKLKMQNEV